MESPQTVNSVKMSCKLVLVLYLFVASVCSAPMQQMQVLPLKYGMQPQMPFLKQMLPLMQSPTTYPQQPLMIILPNTAPTAEADDKSVNSNEQNANNKLKSNTGHFDENKDAVVIDANPKSTETEPKNAVVYLPDEGRYAIGQVISYIPFLPIEINVPDTISWISGLLPWGWFRPQGQAPMPNGNVKRLSNKGPMPILVMPYPEPMPQI